MTGTVADTGWVLVRTSARPVSCSWIDSAIWKLVERAGLGERRKLRDRVELPEQLADHFTRVVAPAEVLHLLEDSSQRLFRLGDCAIGVVLAVLLEALVMLQKFFAEKVGKALARGAVQRLGQTSLLERQFAVFRGHLRGRETQCRQVHPVCQTRPNQPPLTARLTSSLTSLGFALPPVFFMT